MTGSTVMDSRQLLPGQQHPAVHSLHGAALPAGVCVFPGPEDCSSAFLFTRERTVTSLPAAVKTVLENQSKISTLQLTGVVCVGWGVGGGG